MPQRSMAMKGGRTFTVSLIVDPVELAIELRKHGLDDFEYAMRQYLFELDMIEKHLIEPKIDPRALTRGEKSLLVDAILSGLVVNEEPRDEYEAYVHRYRAMKHG